MLDSSPVALPPVRRPLKRSASSASLLTPPRTHHKRKHGHSRAAYDTDTDLDENDGSGSGSEDDKEVLTKGHKKRRMSKANEAEEEEAFWMDSKPKSDGEGTSKTSKSKSSSPAPPLLYRRRVNTTGVAPVSPPPSNRKTVAVAMMLSPVALPSIAGSPPATPEAKFPVRDSPNNPFLDASPANDSGIDTPETSPGPRTPQQERPTVTYVFRGVRGTFPNPLYDHEKNRPISPSAKSRLPTSDPDFSPAPHCPPKLLFPGARRRSTRKRGSPHPTLADEMRKSNSDSKTRQRSVSVSGSDSEDGEYEKPIVPMKLSFASAEREEKGKTRATSSKR